MKIPNNIFYSLRPQFWLLSIIPGVVGIYLSSGTIPLRETALVILALGPGISATAELVNDYYDQETDSIQKVKKIFGLPVAGGTGVIFRGGLDRYSVFLLTGLFVFSALMSGILLNNNVFIITMIGLLLAILYSATPVKLKERGILGLLDIAVVRGFISFHIGWLSFSSIDSTSIIISTFLALLFLGSSAIPHLADYKEDLALNIRTFPVQFGFKKASIIASYFIIISIIFLTIAGTNYFIKINLLVLPFLILSLNLCRSMMILDQNDNILKLQIRGLILLCMAPFIFL